jgi:endonuclease G
MTVHSRLGTVLSVSGTELTLKALMNDPRVVAIEESRAAFGSDCDHSVPFIGVCEAYTRAQETFGEQGDRALVALIDDGIDLLHEAFLDANGKSRVIGVWDQTATGTPPTGFAFGTYHDADQIAGYVAAGKVPDALGRNEPGFGADGGHGTHVASIAVGRKGLHFAGGVAPEAKLLVVIASSDQPTGYSDAHIAALSFIDTIATQLGLPVVVNVSQGMNAGAHDGQSGLEAAFNEFSGNGRNRRGRIVVKSAGNEGEKAGHAEMSLNAGATEELSWTCKPVPSVMQRQRLELWWNASDTYRFRLRAPSGMTSEEVHDANRQATGRLGTGAKFEMVLTKRHADNGASLLAIDFGDSTGLVADGEWTLEVTAREVQSRTPIHAWFERHVSPPVFQSFQQRKTTLSVPGTAQHVITVGAIDVSKAAPGQRTPVMTPRFSSLGPTRDDKWRKPDVVAPGVGINAAKSGTANGIVQMSGTSMAAPHVTGVVALLLSKAAKSTDQWPTSSQVLSLLQQTTHDYNGNWTEGQGYGVVDVQKLFKAE